MQSETRTPFYTTIDSSLSEGWDQLHISAGNNLIKVMGINGNSLCSSSELNQILAGRQTATVFQEEVLLWEVTACLHNAHYTKLMSCEK